MVAFLTSSIIFPTTGTTSRDPYVYLLKYNGSQFVIAYNIPVDSRPYGLKFVKTRTENFLAVAFYDLPQSLIMKWNGEVFKNYQLVASLKVFFSHLFFPLFFHFQKSPKILILQNPKMNTKVCLHVHKKRKKKNPQKSTTKQQKPKTLQQNKKVFEILTTSLFQKSFVYWWGYPDRLNTITVGHSCSHFYHEHS